MPHINIEQIKKTASFLKQLPDNGCGLDFYSIGSGEKKIRLSDMYPSLHHKETINFFFFACLHQHGFWYADEQGYVKPLTGMINGKVEKGSDLLWKVLMKTLNRDSSAFFSDKLAEIEPEELFTKVLADDNGPIPFPDTEERFKLTRAYGRWLVKNGKITNDLVTEANKQKTPLLCFTKTLRRVPGFDKDPAEKKSTLLAMILANRPEKFLEVKDPYNWSPIIDYHVMRVALRLGLIELDKNELRANINRRWVNAEKESEIRFDTHNAVTDLIQYSGRSMAFIDEKMWLARKYCPEMEKPNCEKCLFSSICKKRTELFQPVYRTTAY
jgi:hypothetical protein